MLRRRVHTLASFWSRILGIRGQVGLGVVPQKKRRVKLPGDWIGQEQSRSRVQLQGNRWCQRRQFDEVPSHRIPQELTFASQPVCWIPPCSTIRTDHSQPLGQGQRPETERQHGQLCFSCQIDSRQHTRPVHDCRRARCSPAEHPNHLGSPRGQPTP